MVSFVDYTECLNNQENPRTQSPDPISRLTEVLQRLDTFVEKEDSIKEDSIKEDSEMTDALQDTREDWEIDDDDEEEYTPPANSFFHLPQNTKSSVALSLLHSASTEHCLRRTEQFSTKNTDDDEDLQLVKFPSYNDIHYDDIVGPSPSIMESIAKQERLFAAQHLLQARSRIRQESNNDKVKRIESPTLAGVSPKIRAMERTFEPREDPKAQLLDVLYGDPRWSGKRILDEVEV